MKTTRLFFFAFLLFYSIIGHSQTDSLTQNPENGLIVSKEEIKPAPVKKTNFFDRAWAPIGISLISIDLMRDSAKYGLQTLVRSVVADTFRTHVDDYIHYAPIVLMYAADLFHVPAKNTPWNQTKYLIMSELATSAIVWSLKIGLGIQRPNNGTYNSYPSGHTSQAFVQSQVLYNEFRETAPLLAASGYLFSISTGALRVLNNRHWVPDVLLGAGIGMLVTNAIYYFEPLKNWNPFKKRLSNEHQLNITFTPSFSPQFMGGNLRIRL